MITRAVHHDPRTQYRSIRGDRSDRESFRESFRKSFRESSSNKFDFAYRSDALVRPGIRELRAVKIPASYDAWRPPKGRKNDSEKISFFSILEISFS